MATTDQLFNSAEKYENAYKVNRAIQTILNNQQFYGTIDSDTSARAVINIIKQNPYLRDGLTENQIIEGMKTCMQIGGKANYYEVAQQGIDERLILRDYDEYRERAKTNEQQRKEEYETAKADRKKYINANRKTKFSRFMAHVARLAIIAAGALIIGGFFAGVVGLMGGIAGLSSISNMGALTLSAIAGYMGYKYIIKAGLGALWKKTTAAIGKANAILDGNGMGSKSERRRAKQALKTAEQNLDNAKSQNMLKSDLLENAVSTVDLNGLNYVPETAAQTQQNQQDAAQPVSTNVKGSDETATVPPVDSNVYVSQYVNSSDYIIPAYNYNVVSPQSYDKDGFNELVPVDENLNIIPSETTSETPRARDEYKVPDAASDEEHNKAEEPENLNSGASVNKGESVENVSAAGKTSTDQEIEVGADEDKNKENVTTDENPENVTSQTKQEEQKIQPVSAEEIQEQKDLEEYKKYWQEYKDMEPEKLYGIDKSTLSGQQLKAYLDAVSSAPRVERVLIKRGRDYKKTSIQVAIDEANKACQTLQEQNTEAKQILGKFREESDGRSM